MMQIAPIHPFALRPNLESRALMRITLTCACGERKSVANDLAGPCVTCVACGNVMPVPAMGVRLQRKAKSAPARLPNMASSRMLWMALLAASGLLLLLGMSGVVADRKSTRLNSSH